MKQEESMLKIRKGEKPLVMMMRVATVRVIVVETITAVTTDMVMTIVIVIVRATIVKTMIANTVATIGVNPLVIEKMKTRGFTMKNMMMM